MRSKNFPAKALVKLDAVSAQHAVGLCFLQPIIAPFQSVRGAVLLSCNAVPAPLILYIWGGMATLSTTMFWCTPIKINIRSIEAEDSDFALRQGFSNFFVLRPTFKTGFLCELLMASLDVNDTCKRPVTNIKRHFCLYQIIKMHTIY